MIHGTTRPLIIIGSKAMNFNIGDEKNLIIQPDYDFQERDGKLRNAILTRERKYKYFGDHAKFELTVLCPSGMNTVNFSTHFAEMQYNLKEGALVTFYPHADGTFNVICWVTEFNPFYFKNSSVYDAYSVTMKSKAYKAFSYNQTATPVAAPEGRTFEESIIVTLSCATANSEIYYTTNGSTPTKDSTRYGSSQLVFTQTTTLKAIAYSPGARWSNVMSETYEKLPEA